MNKDVYLHIRIPRWMKTYFVTAAQTDGGLNLSSWALRVCQKYAKAKLGVEPEEFHREWLARQEAKEPREDDPDV